MSRPGFRKAGLKRRERSVHTAAPGMAAGRQSSGRPRIAASAEPATMLASAARGARYRSDKNPSNSRPVHPSQAANYAIPDNCCSYLLRLACGSTFLAGHVLQWQSIAQDTLMSDGP